MEHWMVEEGDHGVRERLERLEGGGREYNMSITICMLFNMFVHTS